MKTILLTLSLALGLAHHLNAQNVVESDQILVRTYEVWSSLYPSEIVISYGNGQTERIGLETLKPKNWEANADKINQVLFTIESKGYEVINSNAGAGDGVYISTYILKRKE